LQLLEILEHHFIVGTVSECKFLTAGRSFVR